MNNKGLKFRTSQPRASPANAAGHDARRRHVPASETWCCAMSTWSVVYFFEERWTRSWLRGLKEGAGGRDIVKQPSRIEWHCSAFSKRPAGRQENRAKCAESRLFYFEGLRTQRETSTVCTVFVPGRMLSSSVFVLFKLGWSSTLTLSPVSRKNKQTRKLL